MYTCGGSGGNIYMYMCIHNHKHTYISHPTTESAETTACNPCPRGKATCMGGADVAPLPGFWSPLSDYTKSTRRAGEEANKTAEIQRSRVVQLQRCYPPTACLGANESYPHGLCTPGAYGPLCGICNETDGFAKSRDGCRKCDQTGTKQSTVDVAVVTGVMGVPIFLTFWYFFALRPLLVGADDEEQNDEDAFTNGIYARYKARLYFCWGRVLEDPVYVKTLLPVAASAKSLCLRWVRYCIKHNAKDYIKVQGIFSRACAQVCTRNARFPCTVPDRDCGADHCVVLSSVRSLFDQHRRQLAHNSDGDLEVLFLPNYGGTAPSLS